MATKNNQISRSDDTCEIDLQKSVRKNGRYVNPWPTWKWMDPLATAAFLTGSYPNKIDPPDILDAKLPIMKPVWGMPKKGINITWLGHASVLVQFDGVTVLTDPVFSNRCSPVGFAGPVRYRPPPCDVAGLPKVNAVVISHNHFDHLDAKTVKELNSRFGAELHWLVPMGLKQWFDGMNFPNVQELDWWETATIPGLARSVDFVFTPSQHWSRRSLFDNNKSLWGGWAVIGPKHRFYFAGDSGYCKVFKQIGAKLGPFDLSAIPIGAYEPRSFMRPQHVNPDESARIHNDVKSKQSVGIHWGTFELTHEHYLDPPKKLRSACLWWDIPPGKFIALMHGESRVFPEDNTAD